MREPCSHTAAELERDHLESAPPARDIDSLADERRLELKDVRAADFDRIFRSRAPQRATVTHAASEHLGRVFDVDCIRDGVVICLVDGRYLGFPREHVILSTDAERARRIYDTEKESQQHV